MEGCHSCINKRVEIRRTAVVMNSPLLPAFQLCTDVLTQQRDKKHRIKSFHTFATHFLFSVCSSYGYYYYRCYFHYCYMNYQIMKMGFRH